MNKVALHAQSGAFECLEGGLHSSEPHVNANTGIGCRTKLLAVAELIVPASKSTEAKRSQAQTLGLHAGGCTALAKPGRQARHNTHRQHTCWPPNRATCREPWPGSDPGGDPK